MYLCGVVVLLLACLVCAEQHRYFIDHEPCYLPEMDKDVEELV